MFLLEEIKYSPLNPVLSEMSSFPRKAVMKCMEENTGESSWGLKMTLPIAGDVLGDKPLQLNPLQDFSAHFPFSVAHISEETPHSPKDLFHNLAKTLDTAPTGPMALLLSFYS